MKDAEANRYPRYLEEKQKSGGDLLDDAALERHDSEVATAASRLKGSTDALAALHAQLSVITQKIADGQTAVVRSAASEKLQTQVDDLDRCLAPFLSSARVFTEALNAIGHWHFESGQMSAFIVATMSQVEIAAGFSLAELRGMVAMVRDGAAPIPSSPPEVIAPVAVVEAAEPTQVVFMLKSAKFRQNGRTKFLPQYEDSPPLPVAIAQKALRSGCAVPLTDDQRRTHRGARSNAVDPKAIDVVDLDEIAEPEPVRYIGPDDPVLRAANFQVIPTRDRLRQIASGRT